MNDNKDLDKFLKKVDEVGSLIESLNENDGRDAIQQADKYLQGLEKVHSNGFDRSIINKVNEKPQLTDIHSTSTDEFVKYVENDAKERTNRKKKKTEEGDCIKERGNEMFKQGKYQEAIEFYTKAVNLVPDKVIFYSNRAQALIKLKRFEEALSDCETALLVDKKFTKLYVHKGRALTELNRYDEAKAAFNEVLKIDKKQNKLMKEYINDVEKAKELAFKTEQVHMMTKDGDADLNHIKDLIIQLRKGNSAKLHELLENIEKLVKNDVHRCCFRISNGFKIFSENPALHRILQKESYSKNDVVLVTKIVALLSSVALDNEENTVLACGVPGLLNAAVKCLTVESSLEAKFESIQLFYRLSQHKKAREIMVINPEMEILVQQSLSFLARGGDIALVAMGMVNNLSLDNTFINSFEKKLSEDFIPGVLKVMELLCLPIDDKSISKTFLPVMSSSISTIANLFRKKELRKMSLNDDHLWIICCKLLVKYVKQVEKESECNLVLSALGMLMNLSTQKVILQKDTAMEWLELFPSLLTCSNATVVQRGCGVLNHILGYSDELQKLVVEKKIYRLFFDILKSKNLEAKKYIMKCVALCTESAEDVPLDIYNEKVLPYLLGMLVSSEEMVVGNTALCLANCSTCALIVNELLTSDLIKLLLTNSTNDNFSKQVRHNCARAIGKYALADQRYLQQVRDLHGLKILHDVMKNNKFVG